MKAAVYTRYGPPDVVQIQDVEKPVPKDNEILIDVRAASVNPLDWHFMRGDVRLLTGVLHQNTRSSALISPGELKRLARTSSSFSRATRCSGDCSSEKVREGLPSTRVPLKRDWYGSQPPYRSRKQQR